MIAGWRNAFYGGVENENESVYVYDYSSYEIPDEINILTKDKLQEIMIKSNGYKTDFMNEKTLETTKRMRESIN